MGAPRLVSPQPRRPAEVSSGHGVRLRVEPGSNLRINFHCPVLLSLVVGAYFSHPLQAQPCEKIHHGQDFYFKKASRRRFCPALAKRSFLQPGGPVLYHGGGDPIGSNTRNRLPSGVTSK